MSNDDITALRHDPHGCSLCKLQRERLRALFEHHKQGHEANEFCSICHEALAMEEADDEQ